MKPSRVTIAIDALAAVVAQALKTAGREDVAKLATKTFALAKEATWEPNLKFGTGGQLIECVGCKEWSRRGVHETPHGAGCKFADIARAVTELLGCDEPRPDQPPAPSSAEQRAAAEALRRAARKWPDRRGKVEAREVGVWLEAEAAAVAVNAR